MNKIAVKTENPVFFSVVAIKGTIPGDEFIFTTRVDPVDENAEMADINGNVSTFFSPTFQDIGANDLNNTLFYGLMETLKVCLVRNDNFIEEEFWEALKDFNNSLTNFLNG